MEEDFVEIEIRIKSRDKTKIITIPQAKDVDFGAGYDDNAWQPVDSVSLTPWQIVKSMSLKFVPVANDKKIYGSVKVVDNKP